MTNVYTFDSGGDFEIHPAGPHKMTIVEWRDEGEQENPFNPDRMQHRAVIVLQSDTLMDSGEPYVHWHWLNVASGPKANLTKIRAALRKKATLTRQEMNYFDPNAELIGVRVQCMIIHEANSQGQMKAKIVQWQPLDEPKREVEVSDGDIDFEPSELEKQPVEELNAPTGDAALDAAGV
jgi:hypothetical protein